MARADRTCSTISADSTIRPLPTSPDASLPSIGPANLTPLDFNVSTLCAVALLAHIWASIAGATIRGALVARAVAPSGSSARPIANFAIVLAVAGATTITSAPKASATWSMFKSEFDSNRPTVTGRCVSASNVVGPTNSDAPDVITTSTCAPLCTNLLARSAALNAAMLPVTPNTTFLPASGKYRFDVFLRFAHSHGSPQN